MSTIGETFEFKLWSYRWGHYDNYYLTKTANGWRVDGSTHSGECDKYAEPYLFDNFHNDHIPYVTGMNLYFARLWEISEEEQMSKHQLSAKLNDLVSIIHNTGLQMIPLKVGCWSGVLL